MTDMTHAEAARRDALVEVPLASAEAAEAFAQRLRAQGVRYVRFEMPDLAGLSRGKTVPIGHLASYMRHGLNLYGGTVAMDSYQIPTRHSGYNEEVNLTDALMAPDPASLSPVPWLPDTVRLVCDTRWYNGRAQLAHSRVVLKRVLAIAAEMGYIVKMGHEYEFYVVDLDTRQPIYGGQPIFATARTHERPEMQKLMDVLDASGIDMITTNAEHGPGQWELNFDALDGVAAADRAFVFKNTVKEYLRTQGLLATFMTKPYKGLSGSCSHFHVSLTHRETGVNTFFDPADPDGMSQTMRQFIQGVLDHARAEMAMWNPTPNCYRRIRPKTYAPSNVSWGIEDRSASVRVKASRDEREHIEVRVPSALSNPYLVAAATIAAGLLGVRDKLPLMDNGTTLKEDNPMFRKLPQSLEESIAALESDTAMVEMLGADIVKVFAATKRQELSRFADEIPPHEVAEYFELY